VRRLIAFAFPGQTGPLYEIVARDAFLDAIDNASIRLRVLEREPSMLDEALTIAIRLEALGFKAVDNPSLDDERRTRERQVRVVGASADRDDLLAPSPTSGRLRDLEGAVNDLRRQLSDARTSAELWRHQADRLASSIVPSSNLPPPITPTEASPAQPSAMWTQ